jgi:hypothetical protein
MTPSCRTFLFGSFSDHERVASARPERSGPAALLRDIFDNPLLPVDPAWLHWPSGVIPGLAQAAYQERHLPSALLDNHRLSVLLDALEEAGCTDAQILNHCRTGGEHVRDCWALDLILGKG